MTGLRELIQKCVKDSLHYLIMVSFLIVFRELAIVRKPLLINMDGIFGRENYGAADTCTCLATAKLDHLLAMLEK